MLKTSNGKNMKLAKTFLLPYLKRFWLMLLSVVFVGAFGSAILIGLRDAYITLDKEIWNLVDECGYPDLYVQTISQFTESIEDKIPQEIKDTLGIEQMEFRASYNSTFEADGKSYSCKIFSYNENGLLKQHLVDGDFTSDGLRMEYYFASANNMSIGKEITLKMHNGSDVVFPIGATFVSAESSIVKSDPYSISSSRDFAYIFLPKAVFESYAKSYFFNEILVNFYQGQEKDGAQLFEELKEIAKDAGYEITEEDVKTLKANIAYMTTYEDSEVISQYHTALSAINMISSLVPAAFFLVVLIVTALFLSQIVRQCRKDIGIMRALGESKKDITLVFVILAIVIAILSWAIGVGIGVGITAIANYAYGTAMKLYPLSLSLNIGVIAIALGAMVFVCVTTSLLASHSISKIKPVEAMKALPPQNNQTPLLVRTAFKNSPITLKISISQTLRNLRRYILSGICLLASGIMIFFALSLELSKRTMVGQLYEVRMNYDIQVYFDNMPTLENIETYYGSDENIKAKTLIKYLPSEVKFNGKEETFLINGISNDQDLIRVVSDYEQVMKVPNEGIVLSNYHAGLLNANVGDILTINGKEVEVKAISHQFLYQVSYMSFEAAYSENEVGSLLVQVNDVNAFFNKYKNYEHVSYISFNEVIKAEYSDRLLAFTYSSYILNAISIVLGFMIVFNMMQTNLKEQKRTYSTIRTLGYQRRSISLSSLFMSLIQYLLAMVLAIPLGILLSKLLLQGISIPEQVFPFPKSWVMYVLSMVFVLAFLLLSHFIAMHSMKKWNLPESVKERE